MTQLDMSEMERAVANTPSADKAAAAALGALIRTALSAKALIWVAMLGSIGLWIAAVTRPEPWRLVAALGATLTVYLPTLFRK